jgi:hypothetical protein
MKASDATSTVSKGQAGSQADVVMPAKHSHVGGGCSSPSAVCRWRRYALRIGQRDAARHLLIVRCGWS